MSNGTNDMMEVIENTEATDANVAAMTKVCESMPYTTTALTAMSIWLSDLGDVKGAAILLACAGEMAKHEAETA